MTGLSDTTTPVDEIQHLWIEMPDGVRLSARLWLPRSAADEPVPALFEYIPYRKGDMVRARDERNHPYFAAYGYACLRVDMRGSGDSEGHMPDMYTPAELADARHLIDWIANQPWCDGSVGMFGTSWGGTASLQASIDAPAALKAVIAVSSTHDRYEDDIHHKGGLILTDSIEWGATLPAVLALPPSAEAVGDDWRALWRERLEKLTFPLETWVREEERSPYWQRGSITFQAERIACPVLVIAGWSDRYSNSVMSLVDKRPDKVWGVVGPWGHHYPDVGHPGPAMGFQQEALKWWDFWLKGRDEAVADWPRLRVWLREFDPPAEIIDRRNGGWVEIDGPPSALSQNLTLYPSGERLSPSRPAAGEWREIPYDLLVGAAAGDTGYFGRFGGLPTDQHPDDARSLVFETAPLDETVILFGAAEVELDIVSDQPLAQIALRLSDVAPDGSVSRVSLAFRNLALSDDLCEGVPMEPGTARLCRIRFHTKAYRFAIGHRIRLSFSSSYWPLAWPAPRRASLLVDTGGAALHLPVLEGQPRSLTRPLPDPLGPLMPLNYDQLTAPKIERSTSERADGSHVIAWHQPFSSQRFHVTGITFGFETRACHSIHPRDPTSAVSRFDHELLCARPDGVAKVVSWAEVRATQADFQLSGGVTATWDGKVVTSRSWYPTIPRRLS